MGAGRSNTLVARLHHPDWAVNAAIWIKQHIGWN